MNVAARSCHSVHEAFAQSILGLVLHEQHYIVHFFYNVQHHQLYLFVRQNDSYLYMMRIYTKIVFEINVDWCFGIILTSNTVINIFKHIHAQGMIGQKWQHHSIPFLTCPNLLIACYTFLSPFFYLPAGCTLCSIMVFIQLL